MVIVGLDLTLVLGYGFLSLWPLYGIVLLARWLKRRAAMRDFAVNHQLTFRGTLPSDKYGPYTAFDMVRQAVLLYMVMEGRWSDFEVAVFDFRRGRLGAYTLGVIVSLPNDGSCFQIASSSFWPGLAPSQTCGTLDASGLDSWIVVSELIPGSAAAAIGPRTAAVLRRAESPISLETNVGNLFVTPKPQVALDGLPDFLDFATSVARGMSADAHTR